MKRNCVWCVLAAIVLVASVQSAQAQIANVSRVRITQLQNEALSIAELLAFDNGTNVALATNGGVANQDSEGFGGAASRGIDGNTNGDYFGANSTTHNLGGIGGFFEVTFSAPAEIDSVQLFGRTDCCQPRDDSLTLTLFDGMGAVLLATPVSIPDDDQEVTVTFNAVPEPATAALMGFGAVALASYGYRRRKS